MPENPTLATLGQYETGPNKTAILSAFRAIAHLAAEIPILSRTLVSAIDAHVAFLITLRNAPIHVRAALRAVEGTRSIRTVVSAAAGLWHQLQEAFRRAREHIKEMGKTVRVGEDEEEPTEDVTKRRMAALRAVAGCFGKASATWQAVSREELRCVRGTLEWWKQDCIMQHDGFTEKSLPGYLQLLDEWHNQLLSIDNPRKLLAVTLSGLSTAVTQLQERERTTLGYLQNARSAFKKVSKASRGMARSSSARQIAPEAGEVDAIDCEGDARPLHERRKLSRKLHALDTAKHRLVTSARDNAVFVRDVWGGAQTDMWGCAEHVGVLMKGAYGKLLEEGIDRGWLPSYSDLLTRVKPPSRPPSLRVSSITGEEAPPVRRASKWKHGNKTADEVIIKAPPIPAKKRQSNSPSKPLSTPDTSVPEPPPKPLPFRRSLQDNRVIAPPAEHQTAIYALLQKEIDVLSPTGTSIRKAPPPAPFAPGYDPGAFSSIAPTPPKVPQRPTSVRARPLKQEPGRKSSTTERPPSVRARSTQPVSGQRRGN
ncbi:hypothetical protein HKX48_004970 [Thoreauomyces humboldtii]|nr:hypothetical protein HKX48_004970 [Thoreauomyces humboldtii]